MLMKYLCQHACHSHLLYCGQHELGAALYLRHYEHACIIVMALCIMYYVREFARCWLAFANFNDFTKI